MTYGQPTLPDMPGDLTQYSGGFSEPQRRRRRTGLRVAFLIAIIAIATAIGITLAVNYEGSYQSPDPGSSSNP